ncbi:MAG: FAD-binding oxidoreductase [Granulosicoccus sp.]
MKTDTDAAKAALKHLDLIDSPRLVQTYSRDCYWYSPVLKARMDDFLADFIVRPKNEAEVVEVLRTCYQHNVPVTTRGAGTGNYGQAMPMRGGCVLHMRNMNQVVSVGPGRVVAQPGCILKDLDAFCIADSNQEIRMFSSTWATATIGGFIAGGSGGVGSVTWGSLRDAGNILKLRVVTMEDEPRILEFTGEELSRVSHAYGTNGIITELELPLAPAYDWTDVFLSTEDFAAATEFAEELANCDGILIKLASVYEAPIAHSYFKRVATYVQADDHLLGLMIAPHAMDAFLTLLARRPKLKLLYRSDESSWPESPGPVFEYGWNHTTLRAIKVDPSITYLQVRYGYPDHLALIEQMRKQFPGEVIQHLEAIRMDGKIAFAGLSLVRFSTEERLDEIIACHEDAGALIFNPHRYTLEEGGRQHADQTQLMFKREADPKGLLNPGKMITWDRPDWHYKRMYDYAADSVS